ncbi:NifU family protein [Cyclobacteriaceae bacterium YHN15]|jgi:Fe-S cluster biogenesis protein NfuA|nr:NifU family protein [Cyclobacteriaceae bacterium YHN15]
MEEHFRERVERALDSIRPFLEADGGNVRIVELTPDMVLRLELTGTCSSCPMSTMTLKAGVEEAIKRDIPEIKKVEAVNVAIA